ncbi:MAG TPA: DEAD/DEAH box helicase family protein, partial [Anaerolineales bacterium]|nr:DEAD/DEAH box helicase family protein [Anaerolineales bacterium]
MDSGARLLLEHLRDLLHRGGRARIVTGDYLNVTDPTAMRRILDLSGDLDFRVYESKSTSFHPKSYLFRNRDGSGVAFVGSSNLSASALQNGIEWNYRIISSEQVQGFKEVQQKFDALLASPRVMPVTENWIRDYEARRTTIAGPELGVAEEEPLPPPTPHVIQQQALVALERTREQGFKAGLVVLATGLGKTWLSAFDSNKPEFRCVLFVAHREEILDQALNTFRRIRPDASLGRYSGTAKDRDAELLFASVQTLSRAQHLNQFAPDHFDYIVVDEFHHATAATYRRLINYFTPGFLLGLTATPDRTDGGDILSLCDENLVFKTDIARGINQRLLTAFQYFGVADEVDYTNIPWRNSRFDEEELTKAVATRARAQNALEQHREKGGDRCLAFCCSKLHADFMAEFFNEAGVSAVAVHSGSNSSPRAGSLEALERGEISALFAVDMFNEGVDIPNVDTVMMLRPTESSIIWMQQLGRGLRRSEGKPFLRVIDYIGNHRSFLVKVQALAAAFGRDLPTHLDLRRFIEEFSKTGAELPGKCEVTYDLQAIDILRSLLKPSTASHALDSFYDDFELRTGTRPTAAEVFHNYLNPRTTGHESWLHFVNHKGGFNEQESAAFERAHPFLTTLEKTPMTKSYKMVLLRALLDKEAVPGTIAIDQLVPTVRRQIDRSPALKADFGSAAEDPVQLQRLLERNPIDAFVGGKGMGGISYVSFDGATLTVDVPGTETARDGLTMLVREIVDWRLADFLQRQLSGVASDEFTLRVAQSNGKPVLFLPEEAGKLGLQQGPLPVKIEDASYVAQVAKIAINVIRREGEDTNRLPEL